MASQSGPSVRMVSWVRLAALSAALAVCAGLAVHGAHAEVDPPGYLTCRPLPPRARAKTLAVGAEVRTEAGQRRRLELPDGSVLLVNEKTRVRRTAAQALDVAGGEVFVEAAGHEELSVRAPGRELRCRGGQFGVRVDDRGTRVVVAGGRARVEGVAQPVLAGQQLEAGAEKPAAAPRVSHVLAWVRDLAAAESPLVPGSRYAGGSLVVRDSDGQEARLDLRRYHVDVHVEDGFARTTIDQTFFNHAQARQEGTFYFPLPADASLSRLAMYVDGRLHEGGMVDRDYGRMVYERIRYQQQDPALLEWVDGSTFRMRVFPLEPRQEKRILLSYTQKLPTLYGQATYRFPAGHSLDRVREFSANVRFKGGAKTAWNSPSHTWIARADGEDLVLDTTLRNARFDRDVVLTLGDGPVGGELVRCASAEQEGMKYLMLRCRPELPASAGVGQRRDWVFLFESSGERDPLLARTQVEIVRGLLAHAGPEDRFRVLTAGSRMHSFPAELAPVTSENVEQAVAMLEQSHLIGALDLAAALSAAGQAMEGAVHGHIVHVGSGVTAMGERRTDELLKRLPAGVRYVGVGVGHRWNRAFMKAAAERTGGYFTQINPDEPVSWRTFELASTLDTPRLLEVRVDDPAGRVRFLPFNRAVAQGEELAAVARFDRVVALPESVTVSGTLDGRAFRRELPLRDVVAGAGYLPRTWAQVEIERLLTENASKHKDAIVALSKAMYVMTPFTSLLVLENEEMYQQYKVDRGRKDHWAMYPAPERIEVAFEPEDGPPYNPRKDIKPSAEEVLLTIVSREPLRLLTPETGMGYQPPLGAGNLPLPTLTVQGQQHLMDTSIAYRGLILTDNESKPVADKEFLGLEAELPKGTRAMAINVEPQSMAAGFVRPNSHVDVLFNPRGGEGRSEVILQNMLVLAVDTTVRRDPNQPNIMRSSFTLATTPAEAQRLKLAASLGELSLSLRAPGGNHHERMPAVRYPDLARALRSPGEFDVGPRFVPLDPFGGPMGTAAGFWNGTSTNLWAPGEGERGRMLAAKYPDLVRALREGSSGEETDRPKPVPVPTLPPAPPGRLGEQQNPESLLYRRPGYAEDEWLFFDLVAYAPGLNTQAADRRTVVEAEAARTASRRAGRIDEAARDLFARAGSAGWRSLTFPADGATAAWTVTFDGQGRWEWQRPVAGGLQEKVVCDGTTLYHVYPELGLAAQRTMGRHYRLAFAGLVPWALPRPEDLAWGADLRVIGERTVAMVPHGAGKAQVHVELHFVFAVDGALAERRFVEKPSGKMLLRETFSAEGVIRRLDGDGKERDVCKAVLAAARAPQLRPNLTNVVVLPLPYRTPEYVRASLGIGNKEPNELTLEQGRALLAAEFAANYGDAAEKLFKRCFLARGQRQIGYYVLLLAVCGHSLDRDDLYILAQHDNKPLARYLTLHSSPELGKHASQWAAASNASGEGLLPHLTQSQALYDRWKSGELRSAELERALAYVRRNEGSPFGWALMDLIAERVREAEAQGRDVRAVHAALAAAWAPFAHHSGLAYAARYEQARSLFKCGKTAHARERFVALYEDTLNQGNLPAVDADFRAALVGDGKGPDAWGSLLRRTATRLVKEKHRPAVLVLARQCWALGDQPAARALYTAAMEGVRPGKAGLPLYLAALDFLWGTTQLAEAEELLRGLLADADLASEPELWRLARKLAAQRDRPDRELECLERALELEFRRPPELIDLQQVRQEYGEVLQRYQAQVEALVTLRLAIPADFRAKVVRVADRWRALDRDGDQACEVAATIFRRLGDREEAWDYLSTPVGRQPAEAGPWVALARALVGQGEPVLADRAFAAAFEAEPTDAQTLWQRAENLQRCGQSDSARKLFRRLAEGTWPPQYAGLQAQARWRVEGR